MRSRPLAPALVPVTGLGQVSRTHPVMAERENEDDHRRGESVPEAPSLTLVDSYEDAKPMVYGGP